MTATFKIFYTFPQLDERQGRPVIHLVTDPRLYRHLEAILRTTPLVTEAILVQRFLSALQQNPEDVLSRNHLVAFLSQECLSVAKKVKNDLNKHTRLSGTPDLSLPDLLQMALVSVLNPIDFFKNFNSHKVKEVFWYSSLKKYTYFKLQSIVIECIRRLDGMETFMRTDLGLASKATHKRVVDALEYSGQTHPQLSRLVLAWKCFQEVKNAGRIEISSPQPQQFQEIAERYNQLRKGLSLTNELNPAINGAMMQEWLALIGKAIRSYTDRQLLSLDAPSAGEDSDSLMEKLPDNLTFNDAEIQELKEQAEALKIFIAGKLEALESSEQRIPLFKNGLQLGQVQISTELDITQPTVGRRYQRFLGKLLQEINQGEWRSQLEAEKTDELSSERLEILKRKLIEQLDDYYTDLIYQNFQMALANFAFEHLEILNCQYILQLDTKNIAERLQMTKDTVEQILHNAKKIVEQTLVESIQTRLTLLLKPTGAVKERIVIVTEEWLKTASYQNLQLSTKEI